MAHESPIGPQAVVSYKKSDESGGTLDDEPGRHLPCEKIIIKKSTPDGVDSQRTGTITIDMFFLPL